MPARISGIISTHDRPAALARTVECVLNQQLRPAELIVVNDGQDELPPEIGRDAEAAGVRFRAIRQAFASLPASRNRGLDVADGEIVVLLDDDVLLPPGYLADLAELYAADEAGAVACIGGRPIEADASPAKRLWDALAGVFAENRWAPRRCRARYTYLPARLAGRLRPAFRLSGGLISLRGQIARTARFREAFKGYALGEDTEFSFRLTQSAAMYVAPSLVAKHVAGEGGRPDLRRRGRMYAANMLAIRRLSVEPGAGTALLLGYHLAGMVLLSALWGLLGAPSRPGRFAAGLLAQLADEGRAGLRRIWCGS